MEAPLLRRLLADGDRLRPIWRLAVFLFVFAVLSVAGQLAVNVLPRSPLQWGALAASTAAALLAGWIVLSRLDQRPPGALGFPVHAGVAREVLTGTLTGVLLIGGATILLLVTRSARFVPDVGDLPAYAGFLGWSFVFFALAAALEEVLFRGYPFQLLAEWAGVWPAVVISSVVFAVLHAQNPNVTPFALVNIFLAGVLLAIAYLRTLSLWFATALHTGWNWMMASVLDFPVSGLTGFDTPVYTGETTGHTLWTGGAFGPEAGLVVTLVLAAGITYLLRRDGIRPHPRTLAARPLALERARQAGLV